MNPDHVHFADWDAAYVLGALSSADRRAFEAHLEDCRTCRTAIAQLAPTLGLLARIDPERAASMLEASAPEDGPGPQHRARVIALGDLAARRRRRWVWGGALAAAAAVVVAIVLTVTTMVMPALRTEVVALEPVVDVPWTATVELTDVDWGTRIDMICRYTGDSAPDASAQGRPYVLVVTSDDGTTSELSTWRAQPGTTARLTAGTALDPDEIATIEVRAVEDGRVLLRTELADAPE